MSDMRECGVAIGFDLKERLTDEEADELRSEFAALTGGMVEIIQPKDEGLGKLKVSCGRTLFVDDGRPLNEGKGKCAAAALASINKPISPPNCLERQVSGAGQAPLPSPVQPPSPAPQPQV